MASREITVNVRAIVWPLRLQLWLLWLLLILFRRREVELAPRSRAWWCCGKVLLVVWLGRTKSAERPSDPA